MNLTETAARLIEEVFGAFAVPQDVRHGTEGEPIAVTLPVGALLIRFVRDRGEDYVDVAARHEPQTFYQADDVDVAFGWKKTDDVLAKRAPEPLRDVLMRLHDHAPDLARAFGEKNHSDTLRLLEGARLMRTRAFEARLRSTTTTTS